MATKKASVIDRHVAKRLREARLAAGVSQEHLAQKVGVSFQQLQKYEKGGNRISAGRLYQLSSALGLSIRYFFEGLSATGTAKTGAVAQKAHRNGPQSAAAGR